MMNLKKYILAPITILFIVSCVSSADLRVDDNTNVALEAAYSAYYLDASDGIIDNPNAYSHISYVKGEISVVAESAFQKQDIVLVDLKSNTTYYYNDAWFVSKKELGLDPLVAKYVVTSSSFTNVGYTYLNYNGLLVYRKG